jgi:hypothetical protein
LTVFRADHHNGGTMKIHHHTGHIKIVSEKEVPYVELKVDMDEKTIDLLAEAGLQEIQGDKDALVSYAFSKGLEEYVSQSKRAR